MWDGDLLSLDGLTTLSVEVADALAKWKGRWLTLNGLTTLSVDDADALARWKGDSLSLDRLTSQSTDLLRVHPDLLRCAAENGGLAMTKYLLRSLNIDPNDTSYNGLTPLLLACKNGRWKIVKELISAKSAANVCTPNDQNTPLHFAAMARNAETVKLLLEHGAYMRQKNAEGKLPLHCAVDSGDLNTIKLLEMAANDDLAVSWKADFPPDPNTSNPPQLINTHNKELTMQHLGSFYSLTAKLKDGDRLFGIVHHVDYRSGGVVLQILYANENREINDLTTDIGLVCGLTLRHKGILVSRSADPIGQVVEILQPIIHRKLEYLYITEEAPRFDVEVSDEIILVKDLGEEVLSFHKDKWMHDPSLVKSIVLGVIMAYMDPDEFIVQYAIDKSKEFAGRPSICVNRLEGAEEDDRNTMQEWVNRADRSQLVELLQRSRLHRRRIGW